MAKLVQRRRSLLMLPLMYSVAVFFSYQMMANGVPQIQAKSSDMTFAIEVTVSKKHPKARTAFSCEYRIFASEEDRPNIEYRLCVSWSLWKSIEVGDPLIISGKEIKFGRFVTAVSQQSGN